VALPTSARRAKARWGFWRRVVQIGFLAAAALAASRWALGVGTTSPEASCPFGAIETLAAQVRGGAFLRNLGVTNWIALGLVIASGLLLGRAFCGWACPIGTLQDALAALSRRIFGRRGPYPWRVPRWLDIPLRWLKVAVLGWVLWASLTALVPPLAPYCPFRTLFAPGGSAMFSWGLMATLALLSVMVERFWCRYLCPLAPCSPCSTASGLCGRA